MIAAEDCATLQELARKCRSMAKGASTRSVAETLSEMARDYETKAEKAAATLPPANGARDPEPG